MSAYLLIPKGAESEAQMISSNYVVAKTYLEVDSEYVLNNPDTEKILDAIESCESQGNPLAKNPHSSAKGLFQFLDGTWIHYGKKLWGNLEDKDVLNGVQNRELARYVVKTYGTNDWLASKDCWLSKI